MEENKEFKSVDTRKEAFDRFKLAVLSSFEEELDALASGMENRDEISINFSLRLWDAIGPNRYDQNTTSYREANREISIRNPKTVEDLKPVTEKEGE